MERDFLYFFRKTDLQYANEFFYTFNFYLKDMNFFRAVDQFASIIVQYDIIQNNLVTKVLVKFTKKIEIDNFFKPELNYEIGQEIETNEDYFAIADQLSANGIFSTGIGQNFQVIRELINPKYGELEIGLTSSMDLFEEFEEIEYDTWIYFTERMLDSKNYNQRYNINFDVTELYFPNAVLRDQYFFARVVKNVKVYSETFLEIEKNYLLKFAPLTAELINKRDIQSDILFELPKYEKYISKYGAEEVKIRIDEITTFYYQLMTLENEWKNSEGYQKLRDLLIFTNINSEQADQK
jgi:hypothetical protein